MQCNVGGVEREVRAGVGGALLAAASVGLVPVRWRIAMAVLGALGLATAAAQYCPLNSVLGIDTCERLPRLRH